MSATDRANLARLFGPPPPEELAGVAAPGDEEDQPPPPLSPEMERRLLADIERAHPSRPGCAPACSGDTHHGVDCAVVRRALREEHARLDAQRERPELVALGLRCPWCDRLRPCGC